LRSNLCCELIEDLSMMRMICVMTAERSTNLEELELRLHQKTLHSHLAKINDELLQMSKITLETENAVVEASMACVEAAEVAKQVKEQLESKRQQELEELEQQKELERIEEEKRRAEQERLLEEERKELEMMRQREHEANQWPWHTYVCRYSTTRLYVIAASRSSALRVNYAAVLCLPFATPTLISRTAERTFVKSMSEVES